MKPATEPEEFTRYCADVFNPPPTPLRLPLADEDFVAEWEEYANEASVHGVWNVLRDKFPQLKFPITTGMSASESYRAATRCGEKTTANSPLALEHPECLSLFLHPTEAGKIPVLVTGHRHDFTTLVRAFAHRNEPVAIPDSQGACMVTGLNNWNRIRKIRNQFHTRNPHAGNDGWLAEFERVIKPQTSLYRDRLIILSDGPYSGVTACEMELDDAKWKSLSLRIRLEHECTHYFTKRVLGAMRNHVLDEILADYMGISAAAGAFRADWFLKFFGLENFPAYRRGGRLENYFGKNFVHANSIALLRQGVHQTAHVLERLPYSGKERILVLLALATTNLAEISGPRGYDLLRSTVDSLRAEVVFAQRE